MSELGKVIGLIAGIRPSDDQITTAVNEWLDDHPEATTTVEDGAISYAKLNSSLQGTVDDVGTLNTEIQNKANVDGSYSTLTAGNAEQLVSTVGVEESTPYLFRTTGGSADVGDRVKVSEITGGTVAWNQLAVASDFSATGGSVSTDANHVATFTASASGQQAYRTAGFQAGHVAIGVITYRTTTASAAVKMRVFARDVDGIESTNWQTVYAMTKFTVTGNQSIGVIDRRESNWDAIYVKNAMFFDLTAMFGSAIADYLYTLESGTAGAGVAKLKSWGFCTKPYYAYDAGSLLSVKTSAHKEIGFNQFDKSDVTANTQIKSDGTTAEKTNMNTSGYIRVVPNTVYYFKDIQNGRDGYGGAYYDEAKNPIEAFGIVGNVGETGASGTKTTPANCQYVRICTHNNDIDSCCVNLHWDGERDGEYEPYEEHTYPLDSDLELRGIPKLDANNNLYYDGDSYKADGTVERRFATVELGSKTWTAKSLSNSRTAFYTDYTAWDDAPLSNQDVVTPALITHYGFTMIRQTASSWGTNTMLFNTITATLPAYTFGIIVPDSMFVDAAAFKSAMNGVYLVYELKTATAESADPYQETQICDDFGTEEFADSRTVPMPVGYNAFYQANLRAKLEMAPDSPNGNGDYIVRQTDGLNEYVLLEKELPTAPAEDGTYSLKCTVADGTATLSWVADE